jgi:hypothetical protein
MRSTNLLPTLTDAVLAPVKQQVGPSRRSIPPVP